jgi:hypothetical protein
MLPFRTSAAVVHVIRVAREAFGPAMLFFVKPVDFKGPAKPGSNSPFGVSPRPPQGNRAFGKTFRQALPSLRRPAATRGAVDSR